MTNANLETYRKALEQAWKDGHVTADERAMLESLRKSVGITLEEHMKIEEEVLRKKRGKKVNNHRNIYNP